ncbi:DeoR/GlpR family DNA-binding transcription regulator [Fibrella aquatilis]|uniref:DeoR/GlpR transcriptional regulator n=1 Tax=Fibrella aquatilis TaxID=2817059 RepID=A0A939G029_9BACT|nr:DeoR/GlpR family DNA-binding transcription regulator [Fibrella aquatilis]MBO0929401.1 DeoR/GlpR transcriptional regulator [Fibrella aquatilis]
MNFQHRKRLILQTLEQAGTADVHELALLLQTSDMTVRRDLIELAGQGLLYRTRGGAMRLDLANNPVRFENKVAQRVEQKTHIARLAADTLTDGDSVFLDCGSTVFQVCQFIRHKRIQVITNSLPVVAELIGSVVKVNLVGGELDAGRQAVHGLMADWHMRQYRATRAFIGVDGVSVANGLSANSEYEASTALAMAQQATHTYLLCDSSKLEKNSYFHFAPLSLVQTLITDVEAPPALIDAYQAAGLTVLV